MQQQKQESPTTPPPGASATIVPGRQHQFQPRMHHAAPSASSAAPTRYATTFLEVARKEETSSDDNSETDNGDQPPSGHPAGCQEKDDTFESEMKAMTPQQRVEVLCNSRRPVPTNEELRDHLARHHARQQRSNEEEEDGGGTRPALFPLSQTHPKTVAISGPQGSRGTVAVARQGVDVPTISAESEEIDPFLLGPKPRVENAVAPATGEELTCGATPPEVATIVDALHIIGQPDVMLYRIFHDGGTPPPPYTEEKPTRAPDVKVGGVCCETPIHAIVNMFTFLTGKNIIHGEVMTNTGLAMLWLEDAADFAICRKELHERIWMAPANEESFIYARDDSAREFLFHYLNTLRRKCFTYLRFPRHAMTVTKWQTEPPTDAISTRQRHIVTSQRLQLEVNSMEPNHHDFGGPNAEALQMARRSMDRASGRPIPVPIPGRFPFHGAPAMMPFYPPPYDPFGGGVAYQQHDYHHRFPYPGRMAVGDKGAYRNDPYYQSAGQMIPTVDGDDYFFPQFHPSESHFFHHSQQRPHHAQDEGPWYHPYHPYHHHYRHHPQHQDHYHPHHRNAHHHEHHHCPEHLREQSGDAERGATHGGQDESSNCPRPRVPPPRSDTRMLLRHSCASNSTSEDVKE